MWMFLVGFVATVGQTMGENASGTPDTPRIVGGYEIDLQYAPFLVSMQTQGMHYCGGAIVTLSHVITGCHCLAEADLGMSHKNIKPRLMKDLSVVAGTEDIIYPTKYMQRRAISEVMIHPNCTYESILIGDFALAFLEEPLNENVKVRPFTLVSPKTDVFDQATKALVGDEERYCYVAGWGSTEIDPQGGNHQASQVLKTARMLVIPDADCRHKLGQLNGKYADFDFARNGQLCTLAHGRRKNESDCRGDSGGPFFCGSRVYGIVSYGYKCGQWDTPNVYAKMAFALDWLKELVKLPRATDADFRVRHITKTSQAASMRELQITVLLFLMQTLLQVITSSLA